MRPPSLKLASATILLAAAACSPTGPSPVPLLATQVDVGSRHSCALVEDGRVFCWGDDSAGQLGRSAAPYDASPAAVRTDARFDDVSAGGDHTCALTSAGEAYCWGANDRGQAGVAGPPVVDRPSAVATDLRFTDIAAGRAHTCAVTAAGEAYCWGAGTDGQLGTGELADESAPTPVTGGHHFTRITAGDRHTCALTADGAAYCWGANEVAQLGTGEAGPTAANPERVDTDAGLVQISAGHNHSCAVDDDDKAYCWGENAAGEIGNYTIYVSGKPAERRPAPVGAGARFRQVSAGRSFSCGVRTQGEGMCWGLGSSGQLGDGELSTYYGPQLVFITGQPHRPDRGPFVTMDAGAEHACGLTKDGLVLCWGNGERGQIGPAAWTTMIAVRVLLLGP